MQILRRPKSYDQLEEAAKAKKEQEEKEKKKLTFEVGLFSFELL